MRGRQFPPGLVDAPSGEQWGRVVREPCPDCGHERLVYMTALFA